jgi:hypothetical protein
VVGALNHNDKGYALLKGKAYFCRIDKVKSNINFWWDFENTVSINRFCCWWMGKGVGKFT